MRHRRVVPLIVGLLASCGSTPSTSDAPSTSTTVGAIEADSTTVSSTVAADRVIAAADESWICSLRGTLLNSSAVADLAVDQSTPLVTWSAELADQASAGMLTRTSFEYVWVDPPADIATVSVTEVVGARPNDPRGPSAPPEGSHQLVQLLRGSVLPELWKSGASTLAMIGPWGVQGQPAWRLHAAARELPDGSLEFLGQCADELSRDLGSLAAAYGRPPNLALVTELISGALAPGAAADLLYMLDGWGWSDGGVDVPPMLFGKVRITGIVYVPTGGANAGVSVRSQRIVSASAQINAAGGNPFALAVAYLDGHPIELVSSTDGLQPSDWQTIASIDPALIPAEGGLVAEVDSVSKSATMRAVSIDEFATLGGYSVESLRELKARFEQSMRLDQSVAEPERYGGSA